MAAAREIAIAIGAAIQASTSFANPPGKARRAGGWETACAKDVHASGGDDLACRGRRRLSRTTPSRGELALAKVRESPVQACRYRYSPRRREGRSPESCPHARSRPHASLVGLVRAVCPSLCLSPCAYCLVCQVCPRSVLCVDFSKQNLTSLLDCSVPVSYTHLTLPTIYSV